MTEQKYKVSCINKGKPFKMPVWTIEKHERALARLSEDQKKNKWDAIKAEQESKYYIIYETAIELDPTCTLEQIKNLHPETALELFRAVYFAGKESIYYQDFRKGKTQSDKK